MKKRFQFFSKNGEIKWTNWFNCYSKDKPAVQFKSKITLLNEYLN